MHVMLGKAPHAHDSVCDCGVYVTSTTYWNKTNRAAPSPTKGIRRRALKKKSSLCIGPKSAGSGSPQTLRHYSSCLACLQFAASEPVLGTHVMPGTWSGRQRFRSQRHKTEIRPRCAHCLIALVNLKTRALLDRAFVSSVHYSLATPPLPNIHCNLMLPTLSPAAAGAEF